MFYYSVGSQLHCSCNCSTIVFGICRAVEENEWLAIWIGIQTKLDKKTLKDTDASIKIIGGQIILSVAPGSFSLAHS